jgi:hypothetical protein
MPHLENDIDELFRKAVKHYSLKPSKSEWNELATRLSYKSISFSLISKYFTLKKRLIILFCILAILIAVTIPIDSPDSYKVHHAAILLNGANVKSLKLTASKNTENNSINESLNSKYNRTAGDLTLQINQVYKRGHILLTKEILQINSGEEYLPVMSPSLSAAKAQSLEFNNYRQPAQHSSLQKLANVQQRGFYYGVVFGPLWSQVRHYEFTKAGFDFGVIIGYRLNRKISIETGVLSTKEYYFVSEKNNSGTSGLSPFDYLQGSREALQIPLNINYQVIQTNSANFFLSAGFTSFVGIDERTIINGSGNSPSSQGFDYGFASYLPSYVSIGAGCEFRIGKLADVRIEPYSQIPLKSSMGNTINPGFTRKSLQFFNAGLRIGITRYIR